MKAVRNAEWFKVRRVVPFIISVAIFTVLFKRIPVDRFIGVIAGADYVTFLALMITNALLYVAWDTLVLTVAIQWFHGQVRWRDLLPIRAASYVFAVFNTNLGRGALALFLSRVLRQPFLQLGSTVIFLVLTEYTHLVVWATLGVLIFGTAETRALLWVPPAIAAVWLLFFAYARAAKLADARATSGGPITWLFKPWRGALLRTFRLAPARRYVQIIILKAPMFFASLLLHYLAAPAFGMVIPFAAMVTFLPVIFMVAALPITVARLGSTQAAWLLLFGAYAAPEQILAFSLAAHLTFVITRALIGVLLSHRVWSDLVTPAAQTAVLAGIPRARM